MIKISTNEDNSIVYEFDDGDGTAVVVAQYYDYSGADITGIFHGSDIKDTIILGNKGVNRLIKVLKKIKAINKEANNV